ncbi:MAG: Na+/H+ antiporter subunit E, partial [Chloroflexota bacterium]
LAFGFMAVAATLLISQRLAPIPRATLSVPGLARFVGFFLWGSLAGGVDVASRALLPRLPLDIHEHWHRFRLPPGPPRAVLVGSISLMPGTLSVRLIGDALLVHSIAGDPLNRLVQLEHRVADMFGTCISSK